MLSMGEWVLAVLKRSFVCSLAILSSAAWADVVFLQNGDRLTGAISTIEAGHVRIKPEYSNAVIIALDQVAEIETDGRYDIKLAGGDRVSGRFVAGAGQQLFETGAGTEPVDLVGVSNVRRAGQNKLAGVNLGSDWESRADLSASVSKGNSDTQAYNALVESVLARGKSEHRIGALISKEEADAETTRDILDIDYNYKRFFNEKWFGSAFGEYYEDQLKDVDYRVTAGAGIGYQFWDDSFGAFSVELGATAVIEELDGDREENPALRWGLNYNRLFWNERAEFFHNHTILAIPDSDRGEIIQAATGLRFALNDAIDASLRADLQHETKPAPGNHKTDVTYSLGVGIKF